MHRCLGQWQRARAMETGRGSLRGSLRQWLNTETRSTWKYDTIAPFLIMNEMVLEERCTTGGFGSAPDGNE